ncbi:MAG TPA: ATP-binding protein [Anaerolineales bacterium]|nr:ATP-binding protein [Anaerolineales bacterium]
MTARLADRLSAARQRRFVGRAAELALWQSALETSHPSFQLIYIYGPGGVGKTTLLGEFSRLCQEAGVHAHWLDTRQIEPAPEPFLQALRRSLDVIGDAPVAEALLQGRHVLLIDGYDRLEPIDTWLRESFLPELPEAVLIAAAGQGPLSPAWRADPGWQALTRVIPLRNLSPEEGRIFLTNQGLPEAQWPTVLEFTHGHPLALSLVADVNRQRPGQAFQPEDTLDVIRVLLERFIQKVPGPAHRAALEACSLVRTLTEGLLATMLGTVDAHDLFTWLRDLSFIESGPDGLMPHDLTRETLGRDLRWRHPDWYKELHRRARQDYIARIHSSTGAAQQQALFDLIYLHRDNAVVRPMFAWGSASSLRAEPYSQADHAAVVALVGQHEGAAAAEWVSFWLERQPAGACVVRDSEDAVVGALLGVDLGSATPADRGADPATAAAWRHLERHAPLRGGETATCYRTWLARDSYQAVSAVQSLLFVVAVRHYLTTPQLAYHFFACAQPDLWATVFAYADLARLPEADFTIDGRRFGVFGHDWRLRPPTAWLTLLAERETAPMAVAPTVEAPTAPLLVLSADDFAQAVRAALRDSTAPDLLRGNPLLRSRLVLGRCWPASDELARSRALADLLRSTAETLLASPRDTRLYRALEATYFGSTITQEQAAERLDLPFSTYRRHLKAGVARLTEWLWQQELGAA